MNKLLTGLCAASFLFSPVDADALRTFDAEEPTAISPALVREGDFAIYAAQALGVGPVNSEAEAESLLAARGVAPRNGWMADYPVTPEVLGEIFESLRWAADEGLLALNAEEATDVLLRLAQELGLPLPVDLAYIQTPPAVYPAGFAYCDVGLVERTFLYGAPPIVSYCHPPARFAYLYYRVPYRFWLFGVRWAHYYILRDFHVVVHVGRAPHHYYYAPHYYAPRPGSVAGYATNPVKRISNHVLDQQSGQIRSIGPRARRDGDLLIRSVRPPTRSAARSDASLPRFDAGDVLLRTDRSRARDAQREDVPGPRFDTGVRRNTPRAEEPRRTITNRRTFENDEPVALSAPSAAPRPDRQLRVYRAPAPSAGSPARDTRAQDAPRAAPRVRSTADAPAAAAERRRSAAPQPQRRTTTAAERRQSKASDDDDSESSDERARPERRLRNRGD